MAVYSLRFGKLLKCLVLYVMALGIGITSDVVAKSMKDVVAGSGLYNDSDKVIILNVTTFSKAVTDTKEAWMIEFYNSWCGHCVRYAPTWKEFASNVYGWRNVVKLGVVDCVVEVNTPLCRQYEIMHYPTVKFFSAHSKDSVGSEIDKGETAKFLRKKLAQTLVKEQQEGHGGDWPNLTPYRSGTLSNLWKDNSSSVKYAVLIFTDKASDIGVEFVLDLSLIQSIQCRVVLSDNEVLAKSLRVLTYPSVVLVDSNETVEIIKTTDRSLKGLLTTTLAALKLKGIEMPFDKKPESDEVARDLETTSEHPLQKEAREVAKVVDVAFLSDMERAVRYSLEHEIAGYSSIKKEVVYNYIRTLHSYFSLSIESKQFFEELLSDDGLRQVGTMSGQEWKEKISKAEMEVAGPIWGPWTMENSGWLGCQGSQPKYRGYPCALWTTFHALTVNAMDDGCDKQDAVAVLQSILAYVVNFFGCSECAEHFQQMAYDADSFASIKSCEEGAQWLWSAHNAVNKRLKNDSTTDPVHPKIQFPHQARCGECYNDSDWVIPNVLKYLSSIYGRHSVNQLGAKHAYSKLSNPVADSFHSVSSGWIMSPLDLSLCVVLYMTSGVIIMFVWFKFLIRRSHRKKAYIHDLLGKV